MNNGSSFIINVTDQLGNIAAKGTGLLFKALRQAGIREKKEVRTIESLGFTKIELDPQPAPDLTESPKCRKCGSEYAEDADFCAQCGTPLKEASVPLVCPSCNRPLGPDAKFCSGCGKQV